MSQMRLSRVTESTLKTGRQYLVPDMMYRSPVSTATQRRQNPSSDSDESLARLLLRLLFILNVYLTR